MSRLPIVLLAGLCLAGACSSLSIENTPVKVTHRNSGPRYDLDEEVDRSKLTPVSQTAPEAAEAAGAASANTGSNKKQEDADKGADSDEQPIGHISIRRIFLVPMVRSRPESQEEAGESGPPVARAPSDDSSDQERAAPFAKPFWPFLTAPLHSRPSHHLLGADGASRSPSAIRPLFQRPAEKQEREGAPELEPQHSRPAASERDQMIDPIKMMLEIMQQAINSQMGAPMRPNSPDLKKEASSRGDGEPNGEQAGEQAPSTPTALAGPPAANETREDVVEIEGKKYLRKAVISRHVGENIIFMTKRLIFVPLEEADSASEQPSTTSTVAPSTSASSATTGTSEAPAEDNKSSSEKPAEETSTTTTIAPTTVAASEPTTKRDAITTEEPISERISEALGNAERMIEGALSSASISTTTTTTTTTTSTTQKPSSS